MKSATANNINPLLYLDCGRGDPVKQGANLAILEFRIGYINSAYKVTEEAQSNHPSEDGSKYFLGHSGKSNTTRTLIWFTQKLMVKGKCLIFNFQQTTSSVPLGVCATIVLTLYRCWGFI